MMVTSILQGDHQGGVIARTDCFVFEAGRADMRCTCVHADKRQRIDRRLPHRKGHCRARITRRAHFVIKP